MLGMRTVAPRSALLVPAVWLVVACSSDSGDGGTSSGSGTTGTGGTGTTGSAAATTGASAGGSSAASTTTATGAGGSATGAGGSATGAGGTGGSGGPNACPGVSATCDSYTEFSTSTAASWGSGSFTGGVTVFGDIMRDMSTDGIHVTGMVAGYGNGFGLWFTTCSDLSNFQGVMFTLSGTVGTDNMMDFQVQTNDTYPYNFDPASGKGACVPQDDSNPFGSCIAPLASVTTGAPSTVMWADLSGGMPVAWDATTGPMQVLGLQWQFPWSDTATSYAVDVTLEDVTLIGGSSTDCGTMAGSGGTGAGGTGAGGTGGSGGTNGTGGTGGSGGTGGTGGTGGGSDGGSGGTGMAGNGGMMAAGGTSGA